MPTRGIWGAYDQLLTVLRAIDGPPTYHTNLEGRVYNQHWGPEEEKVRLPYGALPFLVLGAPTEDDEDDLLSTHPVLTFVGYVAEDATSEANGNAPERAAKLVEDVIKALQLNPKLNNTAESTHVLSWSAEAGEDPEMRFGAVVIPIRIYLKVGHEFIGP